MDKRKWISLLVVILCAFLLAGNVLAMSSSGYMLEWYTPLTGGGGGEASSENFAVNLTIGQTVIGNSSSASYGSGLGYWYGLLKEWLTHLPVILR